MEKGYGKQGVSKQISRARTFLRDSLLERENTKEEQNKITFDMNCYPVFQNFKKVLAELDPLLTSDNVHKAVLTKLSIIGFKNAGVSKVTLFGLCYQRLIRKQIQAVQGEETFL